MSALLALLLTACPSYTASSTNNTYNCGVEAVNGTNPTVAQWQDRFDVVAQGPAAWGSDGPAVSNIGSGCGKPNPTTQVPASFPCELLRAIAMQESGWRQFCVPTSPADQVGGSSRTLISFDCGYGVGQVTSGMHAGEAPAFDRARVAGDALYNLATGASILASKWRATSCVGDNQPTVVEHWYTSVWAYNGLAYSNNPNNPNYSPTRGVWNPNVGGAVPYQERVFGWVEHPPDAQHWSAVALAYPSLGDIPTTGGNPGTLPEPKCATPTSCTTTRATHRSACAPPLDGGVPDAGVVDAGAPDAGVVDGGQPDAGVTDAGTADAGAPVTLEVVLSVQGPVTHRGCGCGAGEGAGLVPLAWLISVWRRRRGKSAWT